MSKQLRRRNCIAKRAIKVTVPAAHFISLWKSLIHSGLSMTASMSRKNVQASWQDEDTFCSIQHCVTLFMAACNKHLTFKVIVPFIRVVMIMFYVLRGNHCYSMFTMSSYKRSWHILAPIAALKKVLGLA